MLNFGASKPRVKGGLGPRGPPGSAPDGKQELIHIKWRVLGTDVEASHITFYLLIRV